jgi:hypothetical protein
MEPTSDIARAAEALARPIEKLIETVASGIGALSKPWMMRRVAKADVDVAKIRMLGQRELLKLQETTEVAQGERGAKIIEAEFEVGEADPMPLVQRARARFDYQESKRQANVENVIAEAAETLKAVNEVSDEHVSDDFSARLFSHVQDVSDDDMRRLWGRILAGEVVKPGRFSLRCLDVLRNLTKEEAKSFEETMPFMFADDGGLLRPGAIRDDLADGPQHPLRFAAIHALADAGLLTSHATLTWTLSPSDDATDFEIRFKGYAIHVTRELREAFGKLCTAPLIAEGVAFSRAGRELASLFRDVSTSRAALENLIRGWHSGNRVSPLVQVHATLHAVVDGKRSAEILYPPPEPSPATVATPR